MILSMITALLMGTPAVAAWDSVGVFHRPEKVVVLINERIERGTRLQSWIELFGAEKVRFTSLAGDIHFECGITDSGSGCTFRFLPGQENVIEGRRVESSVAIADLEPMGFKTIEAQNFDISFLNSNGDAFRVWTEAGRVHFAGQKR